MPPSRGSDIWASISSGRGSVLVPGDVGRGLDGIAVVDGPGLDEADAAVVVVDVEGLALEVEVVRRVDVLVFAVGLPASS